MDCRGGGPGGVGFLEVRFFIFKLVKEQV